MLNVITIQGRLTADPSLKQTPTGVHLCSIVVASERPRKKDSEPVTDFIPCIAWAKTALFLAGNFKKGDMIVLTGRMQSRNYEQADGTKRVAYEMSISDVNFFEPKKSGGKSAIQVDYESINWEEVPDIPEDF